jgi:hypothetical protein
MKLRVVFFSDQACGGATDAVHRFGFGRDIESTILPSPEPGLPLCVRHYLDGGSDLSPIRTSSYLPRLSVPTLDDPPRSVLWDGTILRPDGLLPCKNPNVMTYCPVYHSPSSWVVRSLTLSESLRIYQLPLAMDSLFAHIDLSSVRRGVLPFENSPSSEILTSIIRQLWGVGGGVRPYSWPRQLYS